MPGMDGNMHMFKKIEICSQGKFASTFPGRQRGAVTMFSAILILILLTEMLIYAVQVGVFEQRKSGNEVRQKQAFHAAETGIQNAKEYFLANALDLTSQNPSRPADLPKKIPAYPGGWLSDDNSHWVMCKGAYESDATKTHPCYGEALGSESGDLINLRDSSYFYSENGTDPSPIPILTDEILPNPTETVTVQGLLCLLNLDRSKDPVVQGCISKNDPNVDQIYFMITLLARGQAECDNAGDCAAEALVAEKVGSFGPGTGAGGPGVPLTTRSNFPPDGNAEIVPNPNGGGPGVPISAWINGNSGNPDCPDNDGDPNPLGVHQGGSWASCEYHEWYGVHTMPDDYACPDRGNCDCGSAERKISHSDSGGDIVSMDIVVDDDFPCDLFEYTFKEKRSDYENVKFMDGVTIVNDCSELGPQSRGVIWIETDSCSFNGNATIGSPTDPVFIISASGLTTFTGNVEIYGVLYVTDVVPGYAGAWKSVGTLTVYGAAIVDGDLSMYQGTFQIVYNDNLIGLATQRGSLGKISGGWTDFHQDWR